MPDSSLDHIPLLHALEPVNQNAALSLELPDRSLDVFWHVEVKFRSLVFMSAHLFRKQGFLLNRLELHVLVLSHLNLLCRHLLFQQFQPRI